MQAGELKMKAVIFCNMKRNITAIMASTHMTSVTSSPPHDFQSEGETTLLKMHKGALERKTSIQHQQKSLGESESKTIAAFQPKHPPPKMPKIERENAKKTPIIFKFEEKNAKKR